MRIGIDGRALQVRRQGQPWSGVGQYTYHLLHALFELDKENEYIIWYNGVGKLVAPSFSEYPNVQILRTRWPNKVLNVSMKLFHRPLLNFVISTGAKRSGEISHGTDMQGVRSLDSARDDKVSGLDLFFMPNINFIALPKGVKLVAVAHDLSFEHFPEFFSWKSRLWHKAVNPRALFSRADQIIAVSGHTRQDVIETYGIEEKKVKVVYPGVTSPPAADVTDSNYGKTELRERSEQVTNYLLYLGALEPRKNIMGIIEAYEKLKPHQSLVLAGLSTPYVKELKKKIAKSKLRDRITIIENPSEKQKLELYAGAHVFVYPSFYEGFGFPPLEAMAAGVPVVASSASSVPEICGNAALLVSPWSVQEIKEGMKVLLEDDEMRKTYIEAGRARVKEFSWTRSAQQTLAIFQNIARP